MCGAKVARSIWSYEQRVGAIFELIMGWPLWPIGPVGHLKKRVTDRWCQVGPID